MPKPVETGYSRNGSPFFGVVIVSLNAGTALRKTLESVWSQDFDDYEILIKDGGSTDGSLDGLVDDQRMRIVRSADSGIFDAMNQAVRESAGQFINFLNCGDTFYDGSVLQRAAERIRECTACRIFYGDVHKPRSRSGYTIYPQRLGRYFLYTHSVCQQAWFVDRALLMDNPFQTASEIGGDDIWFKRMVGGRREAAKKIPHVVVTYAGGGVSEDPDRQAASRPYREAAQREAFSLFEGVAYRTLFRLRTLIKSVVYDPFLWKWVRAYRQWNAKS